MRDPSEGPVPANHERHWFTCAICGQEKVIYRALVDDPEEQTDTCLTTHNLCGNSFEICQVCFATDRTLTICPICVEQPPSGALT